MCSKSSYQKTMIACGNLLQLTIRDDPTVSRPRLSCSYQLSLLRIFRHRNATCMERYCTIDSSFAIASLDRAARGIARKPID